MRDITQSECGRFISRSHKDQRREKMDNLKEHANNMLMISHGKGFGILFDVKLIAKAVYDLIIRLEVLSSKMREEME